MLVARAWPSPGAILVKLMTANLKSFGTFEDKCYTYFKNILSIGLAHIMLETQHRVHNINHS